MDTTVIDLSREREARSSRPATAVAERMRSTPSHPALRWIAGGAYWIAHRREDGAPACGAPGDLVVASASVPLCTDCYPSAATGTV